VEWLKHFQDYRAICSGTRRFNPSLAYADDITSTPSWFTPTAAVDQSSAFAVRDIEYLHNAGLSVVGFERSKALFSQQRSQNEDPREALIVSTKDYSTNVLPNASLIYK
jgi:hypothetical protein